MTGEDGDGWGPQSWPSDDPDLRMRPPPPRGSHPQPSFKPPPPPGVEQVPLHAQPTRIVPAVSRPPGVLETQQTPEPEPPPRKRRRGLILAIVVLVLLGLGGGALALPDVSNGLGLSWAPNKPRGPEPEPVAVQRAIQAAAPASQQTKDGVAGKLQSALGDPALGTLSGAVLDAANGEVLWKRDPGKPHPPASTTKLLTAAAALLALEPGSRLETTVVAGAETGEVVLVGGGDPTLTVLGEDSLYPGAATVDRLAAQVKKATGGEVDRVSVDLGAFAGETSAPGWAPEDAPSTYAAPVEAAMADGGRENPAKPDSARSAQPAELLAGELAERLDAEVGSTDVTAPDGADELGKVRSAPLEQLVATTLADSDNVLAESLARRVAVERGAEPSFAGAAKATRQELSEAGFDLSGVELDDASGLSPRNAIPARLLAELLHAAAGDGEHAAALRPILSGLPVAGGTGTLADRYTEGEREDAKGWVRAKTGTLTGVNTLAGVVLTEDGAVLVFALMSTGTNPDDARPALDDLAAALRTCGCG